MIRIFLFTTLILTSLLLLFGAYVLVSPYYYYNNIVNKGEMNSWFSISDYKKDLVKPSRAISLNNEKVINENLWKRFQFKTLDIPLPVKNPFFFVAPVLKYNDEQKNTEFGLSIFDAKDELISQIYFLPKFEFPKILNTQKLFELPIVRDHILSVDKDTVWKDLFLKDLSGWDISFKEMVYNLYLLQVRSRLVNKRVQKYRYIENINKAIFLLDFEDKDYQSELVLSKRGNYIYTFIINSRLNNESANKIKYMMLKDVGFQDTTESLSSIIYQEFKNLPFEKQIDHEGMLYLLSSWSHNQSRLEILASAIQFLERGRENQRQLEPLYEYVFKRLGKTFSKRLVGGVNLSPEVLLKRNIELEEAVKNAIEKEIEKPEKRLSIKEEYERILNETKKTLKDDQNTIRMN